MIGALILGLVAGAVARLVVPGDAFRGMKGIVSWIVTFVLGIAGAYLGWLIFTKGLGIGDQDMFDLGGLLGAIVGAIILLVIFTVIMRVARKGRA